MTDSRIQERLVEAQEYLEYHLNGPVLIEGPHLTWSFDGVIMSPEGQVVQLPELHGLVIVSAAPVTGLFGGSFATWREVQVVQLAPSNPQGPSTRAKIQCGAMKRADTVMDAVRAFVAQLPKAWKRDPLAQLGSALVDVDKASSKADI